MQDHHLRHKLVAELIGTGLLLMAVIGSGIMADRLSAGNVGLALLANTLATVAALYILIEVFGPVSGAHFNPAVSLAMYARGALPRACLLPYIAVQLTGALLGAWLAHAMFELPVLDISSKVRTGPGQWLGEVVATAGLLLVICRAPANRAPAMVATYIGAAYWFTSSTSFANPAAVLGRMFSDTFAGIAPESALPFVFAQLVGATIGVGLHEAMNPELRSRALDLKARLLGKPRASRSTADRLVDRGMP